VSDDNEFDFEIAAEEDDDAAQTEGRGDSEVDVENQGGVWETRLGNPAPALTPMRPA
jgi:hypothetical protein